MILLTDKSRIPFQIDDDDLFCVSRFRWRINATGYPDTSLLITPGRNGKRRCVMLHIFLGGKAPAGFQWDHINQDRRDCRRANLRIVTVQVNQRNVGPRIDNVSGVVGVQPHRRAGGSSCWKAGIKDNDGRYIYLGLFETIEEAAAVRREAEIRLWGADR